MNFEIVFFQSSVLPITKISWTKKLRCGANKYDIDQFKSSYKGEEGDFEEPEDVVEAF
jgi:hypothetical protein